MNNINSKKYVVHKLVCEFFFFFCATESAVGSASSHALRREALRALDVPQKVVGEIFDSGIPTASLVQLADRILECQISEADKASLEAFWDADELWKDPLADWRQYEAKRVELQAAWERLKAMQSKVNVETYLAANPLTPLGNVPRDSTVTTGEMLGEGGFGVVQSGTVTDAEGKTYAVAVKEARTEKCKRSLAREGQVGAYLLQAYDNISNKTHFSDGQGLSVTVVPIALNDDIIIQEKVDGKDLVEVLNKRDVPFSNDFVDDPRKAIERAAGLVLGLHALHCTGKVHCDLKLENIMVEKQKIDHKIRAKAQEILGESMGLTDEESISEAWNALPPEAQEVLMARAETMLPDEEKYQYGYRVIDLGLAMDQGVLHCGGGSPNAAPELLSCVIGRKYLPAVHPSYDMYTLGTMLPSLFFGRGGTLSEKLGINAMQFQMRHGRLRHSCFIQYAKRRAKGEIEQYIFEEFRAMNEAMQKCTGKSYSSVELQGIAQVTADCLSIDPANRPTAGEVCKKLVNLLW
jgi:serine/threonine protein kinase